MDNCIFGELAQLFLPFEILFVKITPPFKCLWRQLIRFFGTEWLFFLYENRTFWEKKNHWFHGCLVAWQHKCESAETVKAFLTITLSQLLLREFLLRCGFLHTRALSWDLFHWFAADDGTILTQQPTASNHRNKEQRWVGACVKWEDGYVIFFVCILISKTYSTYKCKDT